MPFLVIVLGIDNMFVLYVFPTRRRHPLVADDELISSVSTLSLAPISRYLYQLE